MQRRTLLRFAALAALAPAMARGQTAARVHRVAYIGYEFPGLVRLYREALSERGYVEGRNLEFRAFGANEGEMEALTAAAREALEWKPDVIRTGFTKNTRVAAKLTATIPIVFDNVNDPVAAGFVTSLARPTGNLTGVAIMQAVLTSKRVELVRELMPRARRVALIIDSAGVPLTPAEMKMIHADARRLGITLVPVDTENDPRHLVGGLERIAKSRIDAAIVFNGALDARDFAALGVAESAKPSFLDELYVDFQRRHRIAMIRYNSESAERGIVATLGGTWQEQAQITADQTVKILSGRPISEIPVQQFSRVEVAVNLKMAKDLGIKVPQSILARADKVVQ